MAERNLGKSAGWISVGEVMNRDDDPSQTGSCRVNWKLGGISQDQLKESELPWSPSLSGSANPSLGHTGGPHTGHAKGSQVIGISPSGDGQDFIILGSMPKGGTGQPDGNPTYSSDLPYPALSQENGGEKQSGKSGDVNGIVTQNSIVKYGEEEGGNFGNAKYAKINEPIGTWDSAITS